MKKKVICEKADRTDIPTIDKKKYLVPSVRKPCDHGTPDDLLISLLSPPFLLFPSSTLRTGSNRRAICIRDPQADQARARESYFYICGGNPAANCGFDERDIRGAQVSRDPQQPCFGTDSL